MTKLTYTNDQQIINDAAQKLIEAHLRWSGSNEGAPSKDLDNVHGSIFCALMDAATGVEKWYSLNDDEKEGIRNFQESRAELLFVKAGQLADRKWEAVMALLAL